MFDVVMVGKAQVWLITLFKGPSKHEHQQDLKPELDTELFLIFFLFNCDFAFTTFYFSDLSQTFML